MASSLSVLLIIIGFYLAMGMLFSIIFLWKGITRVDPATRGSGFFFKALIFPGLCVFWIIFLIKWKKINNQ